MWRGLRTPQTSRGPALFPYLFKNPRTSLVVRGVKDDWEKTL